MPLEDNEGSVSFRVELRKDGDHEDLVIDFGQPLVWIGFHKADAERLISILQEKVKDMKDEIRPRFIIN